MAKPRPHRGKSLQSTTKPLPTATGGSRPISPPPSSQSINGSSPPRSECRMTKSISQGRGHRARGKSALISSRESSPLADTPRQREVEGGPATVVTRSPVPSNPGQSPPSQDAHISGVVGDSGATKSSASIAEDKTKILKLCYENRMALLDCPFLTVGAEEGFWRPLLETIKAQERQVLPPTVSFKWSALRDYVNAVICRQRRDRTKGNVVPPRRKSSPVLNELDTWIDKWIEVGKFREVQVLKFKLSNAVKELLGRSRLEDGMGGRTDELEISMADPNFSIYLPEVAEAIDRCREQLQHAPGDHQSDSQEACKKVDYPHGSGADSSDHRPWEHIGSDATPLIETSSGPAEDRESLEDILKTPPRTQESSVRSKGKGVETRRCSVTEDGSVILGSTQPTAFMELNTRSARHENEPASQGPNILYPLKACSAIVPSPVCSASDDDEELPELTMALFSTGSSGLSQSSSTAESAPTSTTASENAPSEKTALPARKEGPQPQEERRSTDNVKPHITEASGQAQDRVARTPALVAKENTRYALKHAKPLAPVNVPHRSEPNRQPSPNASKPPSQAEIEARVFYASSRGNPSKQGRGTFVTPLPLTETPLPTPIKAFKNYETSPSVAGQKPIHRKVDSFEANPKEVDGSAIPDEKEYYVLSDLETWYHQQTTIPPLVQSMETGKRHQDQAVSLEGNHHSSQRSHSRDIEDTFIASTANKAARRDFPYALSGAGVRPGSGDSARGASNILQVGHCGSESSKSKKRKRGSHSTPDPNHSDSSPFAPTDVTNYSAAAIPNANLSSPSVSQSSKRQKRRRPTYDSRETSASTSPRTDQDYDATSSPTPPKGQRLDDVSPSKSSNEQRCKGHKFFGNGKSGRRSKSKFQASHQRTGQAQNIHHAKQRSEPQPQTLPSSRKGRSRPQTPQTSQPSQTSQTPQTPHTANRGQPSFSLASKRNQDHRQQQHHHQDAWTTRDRFTTPATFATMQSPASSGLFVPFGSSAQSGRRSTRHRSSSNFHDQEFPGRQQEQQQQRSVREGTECTEDFRLWTPTSQVNGIRNRFTRLRHKQQQLDRDLSRLAKRVKICDFGG